MVRLLHGLLVLSIAVGCGSGGSSNGDSNSGGAGGAGNVSGKGASGGSGGDAGGGGSSLGGSGGAGASGAGGSGGVDCSPGASDSAGNDIDENCDGVDGTDADGDGVASTASGGTDCDDAQSSVFPGSSETWLLELVAIDYAALCGGSFAACNGSPWPESFVVDAAGGLHMALRAPGHPFETQYVANTGGAWWFEKVTGLDATDPNLAIGPNGERWVAYVVDGLVARVYLSSSPGSTGSWQSEALGNLTDLVINPAIASDASGVLHLIATDQNQAAGGGASSPNDLFYATSQDGFQSTEIPLPGTEKLLGGVALAVSTSGQAHASWFDAGTTTVNGPADPRTRYADLNDGSVTTIDDAGSSGPTAIALDANDEPVVSYFAASGSGTALMIARQSSGTWSSELVLAATSPHYAPVAYGDGKLHLCTREGQAIRYGSRTESGNWQHETVVPVAAQACRLVFDAAKNAPRLALSIHSRLWTAIPSPSPGVDRDCDGSDD